MDIEAEFVFVRAGCPRTRTLIRFGGPFLLRCLVNAGAQSCEKILDLPVHLGRVRDHHDIRGWQRVNTARPAGPIPRLRRHRLCNQARELIGTSLSVVQREFTQINNRPHQVRHGVDANLLVILRLACRCDHQRLVSDYPGQLQIAQCLLKGISQWSTHSLHCHGCAIQIKAVMVKG